LKGALGMLIEEVVGSSVSSTTSREAFVRFILDSMDQIREVLE
jgi:hypothetical protein